MNWAWDSRGFVASLWILPAVVALMVAAVLLARKIGTFHPLYNADLAHVDGYVLWTMYQQFLLQDYFMPRLTRLLSSDAAIGVAAVLFAIAHLPNLSLVVGDSRVGSSFLLALPPLPQPLHAGLGAGTARALLRSMRPRRNAPPHAGWTGILSLPLVTIGDQGQGSADRGHGH